MSNYMLQEIVDAIAYPCVNFNADADLTSHAELLMSQCGYLYLQFVFAIWHGRLLKFTFTEGINLPVECIVSTIPDDHLGF